MVLVKFVKVCEPETALLPLHPPLAMQEAAFVEDHVNVLDPPEAMEVGETLMFKVGAVDGGGNVTAPDPVSMEPPPLQAASHRDRNRITNRRTFIG